MSFRRNRHKHKSKGRNETKEFSTNATLDRQERQQFSAAAAVRARDSLRGDCTSAMRRICPQGWDYNYEKARKMGLDQVGYYPDDAKIVDLDPEEAHELFVHHNYSQNRSFDQAHSSALASSMLTAPAVDIAVGPGGHPVIVNGQHTMWAIFMRGQTTSASITIYQCRDEVAIAQLFTIFDSNKKRSLANALDAQKGCGAIHLDVPSGRHHRWSQCAASAENDFKHDTGRHTLMVKTARATRDIVVEFSKWMESMIENNHQAKMVHQGIGAAFYAMFICDRIKATEFVKRYITGLGIDTKDDPVGQLRNRMTINKPHAEHGATACRMHAGLAFTAWRAFCLKRPLLQMRTTKELPAVDRWKIYASALDATDGETEQ